MSQISLTASMRSNLLSLQGTSDLMGQTQERLATGKKVNSAIDNPSSYYTAQSLSNRANDLSGLLDSMGQAISTIKAADEGIEAITSYVEQAKAVATNAFDTTDVEARSKYNAQFNEILQQINKLAGDASYKGVNLLKEGTLKVTFNEGRNNSLVINGVDATTNGGEKSLNIADAAWGGEGVTIADSNIATATGGKITTPLTADKKYINIGDDVYLWKDTANLPKGDDGTNPISADNPYTIDMSKVEKLVKESDNKYYNYNTTGSIDDSITATTNAVSKLRTYASDFGNNYAIVQARENFTNNLINVLEEGADKLTLADMNEESANMLALQTRQQLAINSLSLASQAAQSVLKLFS